MIAVDASALLSIVFGEPDAPRLFDGMSGSPCVIGSPTAFEAEAVAKRDDPSLLYEGEDFAHTGLCPALA